MKNRLRNENDKEIAIVGMSCRFPGAKSYQEFWRNLSSGVNSIREIPTKRWGSEYHSPDINAPNKSILKWCGILDDVEKFDNRFFNISPREASIMDPQQRLLLEETYHCMEDSGIALNTLQKQITSVYLGVMAMDYQQEAVALDVEIDSYTNLGNLAGMLANRISYIFNFRGLSISIDTACSSSLVAVHEAKRSLRLGESDFAVAAGVNLCLHPWRYISYSKARMLSIDGQCKTFDESANGFVPGEGVGVLLLQRLSDAIKMGNHVYGVLKGSAVNHGGKTLSITAPSVKAQRDMILAAYEDAAISPDTIGYIEAHGTGTSLGDPIEVEALTQAFRIYTKDKQFCKIGSVKTNIGHLEAAAGIAGVIKVLLMFGHCKVPRTLNINTLNPIIDFESSPFVVASSCEDWCSSNPQEPLRAGVSSFGMGGISSHVILEKFTGNQVVHSESNDPCNIFLLSAKTSESLTKAIQVWKETGNKAGFSEYSLNDICSTLMVSRDSFAYRFGCFLKDKDELKELPLNMSHYNREMDWYLKVSSPNLPENLLLSNSVKRMVTDNLIKISKYKELLDSLEGKIGLSENKPLLSFVVVHLLASALIHSGFHPSLIMGENTGVWTALTLSGMIKLEDTLAILNCEKELHEIEISRPKIPFYDPVFKQIIKPYYYNFEYVDFITEELHIPVETIRHFVEKGRLMYNSQFTFKKSLYKWNDYLMPHVEDIERMLYDNDLLLQKSGKAERKAVLLVMIIISCLRHLYQRWELTEHKILDEERIYELLDLVEDNLLPQDLFVKLILQEDCNSVSIARILDQNQHLMSPDKPYKYIKNYSRDIAEVNDKCGWIREMLLAEEAIPINTNIGILYLGEVTEHCDYPDIVNIEAIKDIATTFKETLLDLWLKGVNIDWTTLITEKSFKRVPLPGYAFDGESFWVNHTGSREASQHTLSACCSSEQSRDDHRADHNAPTDDAVERETKHERIDSFIEEFLKELLIKELRVAKDELYIDTKFGEFGVDSILLAELVKEIEEWVDDRLDPSVILEYPTINELGGYLRENYANVITLRMAQADSAGELVSCGELPKGIPAPFAKIHKKPTGRLGRRFSRVKSHDDSNKGKIAVIGMACHFPGAKDTKEFWNNLVKGRDSIVEVPNSRWDVNYYYSPIQQKGKSISKWGGFIDNIEYFDPAYFNIRESVAPQIDPLVRLFLEVSVAAIRDAGYENAELSNKKVGVYVGSRVANYSTGIKELLPETISGIGQNFIAAHVSHFFNFKGPNLVVDTACSSSLVSVHLACQSLINGESEYALAGGVDILLDEKLYLILSEGRALSPNGKCYTFDEKADGFVPGEGCGAVLLKRLDKAISDGDQIYAVIDAVAVNNDGRTMGITTPNPEAQRAVIIEALRKGRVAPESISYIETHGTGTMIGDPIELKALMAVFQESTSETQFCPVGSVKTNIGHLLSAAGIASLIKVVLSIRYKQLPPTLNCDAPNPRFKFERSPFYPNTCLREWQARKGIRRAGISSFGFGGTNAHAIISELNLVSLEKFQPVRNPLPTVKFDRKRYWIAETQSNAPGVENDVEKEYQLVLHKVH